MKAIEALPQPSQSSSIANDLLMEEQNDGGTVSKALVIDGMAVVQELSCLSVRSCKEFADHFLRTIVQRTNDYDMIHLVFDRYDARLSLKQLTRNLRHGSDAQGYDVTDCTQIKVPLKKFLSSSKTKDKLTVYLAKKALVHFTSSSKCLVVSTKEGAQSQSVDVDPLCSNHEETDTCLILHALYASAQGQTVHIMSPDTDVFILALRRQPELGDGACLILGTGDKRRVVLLKPIYTALGPNLAQSLPGFHAFTGSDTTGKFAGKGKLTCWKTLLRMKEHVLTAFAQLGTMNSPTQEIYDGLEEFVCKLYVSSIHETKIEKVRWHLFKKNQAEGEKLPPTRSTLKYHILRSHFQAMVWNKIANPDLPSPEDYGWVL